MLEAVGDRLGAGVWYWIGDLRADQLKGINLPLDSQFYILKSKDSALELVEVYDVSAGGHRVISLVGSLEPATGAVLLSTTDRWQRRGNLWGTRLRTSVLPWCPGFLCVAPDGPLDSWHGVVPEIFQAMARRLNFTYSLALSSDGKWGGQEQVGGPGFHPAAPGDRPVVRPGGGPRA
jgi:hypothetical protein